MKTPDGFRAIYCYLYLLLLITTLLLEFVYSNGGCEKFREKKQILFYKCRSSLESMYLFHFIVNLQFICIVDLSVDYQELLGYVFYVILGAVLL